MADWTHVRTERLWLDAPVDGDADALFAIHSAPSAPRAHGASRRTAEKLGLRLVWRGPDDGNPDPDAVRLVFLDREPDDVLVTDVATEGWAPDLFLR